MQQTLEGVKLLDVVIARKENVGKSGFLLKVPWYQMEHKSPKDTEVGTFLHIYFSIMHDIFILTNFLGVFKKEVLNNHSKMLILMLWHVSVLFGCHVSFPGQQNRDLS